jgi:pyruvate-ferredoxin/flavodoxin oxidoreductase
VVAPYLINKANFIACHNFTFLKQVDMLCNLEEGGTFLLTTSFNKDAVWNELPGRVQKGSDQQKGQVLHHRRHFPWSHPWASGRVST